MFDIRACKDCVALREVRRGEARRGEGATYCSRHPYTDTTTESAIIQRKHAFRYFNCEKILKRSDFQFSG